MRERRKQRSSQVEGQKGVEENVEKSWKRREEGKRGTSGRKNAARRTFSVPFFSPPNSRYMHVQAKLFFGDLSVGREAAQADGGG